MESYYGDNFKFNIFKNNYNGKKIYEVCKIKQQIRMMERHSCTLL